MMLLALGDWGETMAETIAGGYYIGEDGRPHDAFGRALPDLSVAPEDQATPEPLFSEEDLRQMDLDRMAAQLAREEVPVEVKALKEKRGRK